MKKWSTLAWAAMFMIVVVPPQTARGATPIPDLSRRVVPSGSIAALGAPPDLHHGPPAADDSLTAARDLYSAAEYENALLVLDRLRTDERRTDQARVIDQYRAFCLLALGRAADAEQAIAAVVVAEPSYQPSDADVSPRVRLAFSEVRRRMWPSLVQQRYAAAKVDFDRKNFSVAAGGFAQVLDMLVDSERDGVASQPQLADIRMLATEFKALSMAHVVPAPPAPLPASTLQVVAAPLPVASLPAAPPPVVVVSQGPALVAPTAGTAVAKPIFTSADFDVVPPITIRQGLPPFPPQLAAAAPGVLEVVIGETGAVETATMQVSVNSYYDRLALDAVRSWKYQPATLKGEPVKYRKSIQVTVKR